MWCTKCGYLWLFMAIYGTTFQWVIQNLWIWNVDRTHANVAARFHSAWMSKHSSSEGRPSWSGKSCFQVCFSFFKFLGPKKVHQICLQNFNSPINGWNWFLPWASPDVQGKCISLPPSSDPPGWSTDMVKTCQNCPTRLNGLHDSMDTLFTGQKKT